MPSNDTENIYATQYGGEGEPIPASKISYNNITSGLTADDIQEAVDELAVLVGNVDDDVDTLKTSLRDTYVLADSDVNIEVTADGVKSYADLLGELTTAFLAYLAAMEDDELLFITGLEIANIGALANLGKVLTYKNTDVSVSAAFSRVELDSTRATITTAVFGGTTSLLRCGITTVPAVTISDIKSNVPTENAKISVSAHLYKKV